MIFIIFIVIILNSTFLTIKVNSTQIKFISNDVYNFEYQYQSYQQMTSMLQNLSNNNQEIMSLKSIGQTYEGREIWMVKLSDNVNLDEDEPEILLMGAHHGNEKPSYEALIVFIKHMIEYYNTDLTDNDKDGFLNEDIIDGVDNDGDGLIDEDPSESRVKEAIYNTEIFIIPMVNPDGVEANTRKNCAPNYGSFGNSPFIKSYGVDLNRNYGYKWYRWFIQPVKYSVFTKQFNTKSDVYRGEKPFCENETIAISDLVNRHNFTISLSYHTYGEKIVYPWNYKIKRTIDDRLFKTIGKMISDVNSYQLVKGSVFFPNIGNSNDWLYGVHRILAYTIELGKSYAPTEEDILLKIFKIHIGVNLLICELSNKIDLSVKIPIVKSYELRLL